MIGGLDTGMDLDGRAALLALTASEFVALGTSDPRIVAFPALASSGAVGRLRRWLTAGQPIADLSRLAFVGDDAVRALVVDVIADVPAPVAWHAVEHVAWFEVGRATAAWLAIAPSMRAPIGDVAHVVAINGRTSDHDLRGVIAHELGHSWHRHIFANVPQLAALPEQEVIVSRVLLSMYTGRTAEQRDADADRWVRDRVANEVIADQSAAAWGVPHNGLSELEHRRYFKAQYDAAESVARERDREIAEVHTARAAAARALEETP
jgi:hypothetical protein